MRLLNSIDLCFRDFPENQIPTYYILSHRWIGQETTYAEVREILQRRREAPDHQLAVSTSVQKILSFCEYAVLNGIDWVWVDTCCINKESSAELSEAINSMFKWYQDSATCIVYLSDVQVEWSSGIAQHQLTRSEWFTRGWALQELLAPRHCLFVDCNWTEMGTKKSLSAEISACTGIDQNVLLAANPRDAILNRTIATRMSWAANRITTRTEDIAYCLLGLFDVNMSLLYGEGDKAFIRLQRKLSKYSNDESLFAWDRYVGPIYNECSGLFATHPAAFSTQDRVDYFFLPRMSLPQSNQGLEFSVFNQHLDEVPEWTELILPLACVDKHGRIIGVPIVPHRGKWLRDLRRELTFFNVQPIKFELDPLQMGAFSRAPYHTVPICVKTEAATWDQTRPVKAPWRPPALPVLTIFRFRNQGFQLDSMLISLDVKQLGLIPSHMEEAYPDIALVKRACNAAAELSFAEARSAVQREITTGISDGKSIGFACSAESLQAIAMYLCFGEAFVETSSHESQ